MEVQGSEQPVGYRMVAATALAPLLAEINVALGLQQLAVSGVKEV